MSGRYTSYIDNFDVTILFYLLMQTFDDTFQKNLPLGNVLYLFFVICFPILKEMWFLCYNPVRIEQWIHSVFVDQLCKERILSLANFIFLRFFFFPIFLM